MALAFDSSTVSVGDPVKKKQYTRMMDNVVIGGRGDAGMPAKIFFSSATFLSEFAASTVLSRTATAGFAIGAGLIGQSATASVTTFKYKTIDIGPWDMKNVGYLKKETNINRAKWREVQVLIYPDPTLGYDVMDLEVPIEAISPGGLTHASMGFWQHASSEGATEIGLVRYAAQFFAGNHFTSTSFNRGKITMKYEE